MKTNTAISQKVGKNWVCNAGFHIGTSWWIPKSHRYWLISNLSDWISHAGSLNTYLSNFVLCCLVLIVSGNSHFNLSFVQLVLGNQEFKWTIKDFSDLFKIEDPIISSNFTVYGSDSPYAEHFHLQVSSYKVNIFPVFNTKTCCIWSFER